MGHSSCGAKRRRRVEESGAQHRRHVQESGHSVGGTCRSLDIASEARAGVWCTASQTRAGVWTQRRRHVQESGHSVGDAWRSLDTASEARAGVWCAASETRGGVWTQRRRRCSRGRRPRLRVLTPHVVWGMKLEFSRLASERLLQGHFTNKRKGSPTLKGMASS